MRAWLATMLLVAAVASVARAAPASSEAAGAWRTLTRVDVDAAYRLLKDNHPGAAPEAADPAFVATLEAGHTKALQRAAAVRDLAGYRATLAEFAHGMGDAHISTALVVTQRTLAWAGVIPEWRGGRWVVRASEPRITGRDLTGAELVSCDGRPAEAFATQALAFHATPGVEAFRVLFGGWVLVDDGNPFVRRPSQCVFRQGGALVTQPMTWTDIAEADLRARYWKRNFGEAGFGVRKAGSGYWIAVGELSAKAQPVIDAAKAEAEAIRQAPFVVVDLRGNGGGDDAYGMALAQVLYGAPYVEAVLGPESGPGDCATSFRASSGNLKALGHAARAFEKSGDQAGMRAYDKAVADIRAAQARGQAFSAPTKCPPRGAPKSGAGLSLAHGPVLLLLTDAACFSSCIGTVDFFRRLGAAQVGQPTAGDTHYSEYRQETLPSGLSFFSTLQALTPDMPAHIGPFAPRISFDGDMADTKALEAWVAGPVLAAVSNGGGTQKAAGAP